MEWEKYTEWVVRNYPKPGSHKTYLSDLRAVVRRWPDLHDKAIKGEIETVLSQIKLSGDDGLNKSASHQRQAVRKYIKYLEEQSV